MYKFNPFTGNFDLVSIGTVDWTRSSLTLSGYQQYNVVGEFVCSGDIVISDDAQLNIFSI